MNMHAPERQPDESMQDYRARRHMSQVVVWNRAAPSNPTSFAQHFNTQKLRQSKRDLGQHPKFDAPRKHKPKKAIKPTWPHTDDQCAQSRPLIVLGKNRERDPAKREKPKSAVAKRMDRPSRTALMENGHAKLMRFFTV